MTALSSGSEVLILDTGLGNLGSLRNMCRRVGVGALVSKDPKEILAADRLILPGIGSFDEGMRSLRARDLIGPLGERVHDGTPILGVCLGMQLMTHGSEEGEEPGLGWFDAVTLRLPADRDLRVPHMGWNAAHPTAQSSLFTNMPEDARFYFVHSYYVSCQHESDVLAWTDYGIKFASSVRHGSMVATQFHPEKSHRFGMQVLQNFVGTA